MKSEKKGPVYVRARLCIFAPPDVGKPIQRGKSIQTFVIDQPFQKASASHFILSFHFFITLSQTTNGRGILVRLYILTSIQFRGSKNLAATTYKSMWTFRVLNGHVRSSNFETFFKKVSKHSCEIPPSFIMTFK